MNPTVGRVYLVGAGPGDPGLLTLRGAECLRRADVVLYDYLASPHLLAHAEKAERICLGRHGHGRIMTQDEVNNSMVKFAREGRCVVRLKGGDPTIFARASDELAALQAAGVPYEIVPGVSAAQAASSYAGIPLTHRSHASCVALVAGHESGEKSLTQQLDYRSLAQFPGTLVFYMGVTTAPQWSGALIAAGKPPETPVAIVRRCSLPDQATFLTTLGEVGNSCVGPGRLRPPAVVIVGEVARQARAESWFTLLPLFGRRVLVTRPVDQGDALARRLRELGADVLHQPAIVIRDPPQWEPLDAAIRGVSAFDWLVFSSANGVRYFMKRLHELGYDSRTLGRVKLAAIGPGTSDALAAYNLRADLQPAMYRAEELAASLSSAAAGCRFLLVRASRGREVLAERLTASGGLVTQVVAYESIDVTKADEAVIAALAQGSLDWVTVTSSSIARSLVSMFGDLLRKTRLAAISPVTADALSEAGHAADVVAEVYTSEGLVDAILSDAALGKL